MSTVNPDTLTPEQIKQTAEELAKVANQEVEIKLETGQVYRGKTMEEATDALKRAQEEASRAISQREERIRQLEQQVQTFTVQQQPPPVSEPPSESYNHDRFLELLAKDGREAYRYATGFDPVEAKEAIQITRNIQQIQAVGAFQQARPDYPATPEASQSMLSKLDQMGYGDRYAPPEILEVAYNALVREGRLTPQLQTPEQPTSRGAGAPPPFGGGVPRGTETLDDLERQAYGMTTDQLKAFIESKQGG